jgi:hypothetical protein
VTRKPAPVTRKPAPVTRKTPARLPTMTPRPIRASPLRRVVQLALAAVAVATIAGGAWAYRQYRDRPTSIESVTPPGVRPGQLVSIIGTGFETDPQDNTVRFGDVVAPVTSASQTRVQATVPAGLLDEGSMNFPVSVEARGIRSNALPVRVFIAARVDSVEPSAAIPGDEVVIRGANLAGENVAVNVGGVAADVLETQPTLVRFRVPELPVTEELIQKLTVRVGQDWTQAGKLIRGRLPILVEAQPPRGTAGQRVVLRGYGFDPEPGGNVVTFGDLRALVLEASPNELVVSAPAGGLTVRHQEERIVVESGGRTSSGDASFEGIRASTSFYLPHFFAAPVPGQAAEDHAFVSTELAPVLLLSGSADAPSTAERAVRVANRLNGLAAAMVQQPLTLELREEPAPAVAVRETSALLITATAEDAAGYGKSWYPKQRRSRPTPLRLAGYWEALLHDYFALFVQRQRPFRVLEMSPSGQVLTDFHRDAVLRTGSAAGVPLRFVVSLEPEVSDSLRRLALVVPRRQESRAGSVLVGRWTGTMQVSGEGSRPIQVSFAFEGSRLAGRLTTRSGGVSGEVRLRDLTLRNRSLSFSLEAKGGAHRFRGTFEGSTISGTVKAESGAKTAEGKFHLRYAP